MSELSEYYNFRKETRKKYFKAFFVFTTFLVVLVGGFYGMNTLITEINDGVRAHLGVSE